MKIWWSYLLFKKTVKLFDKKKNFVILFFILVIKTTRHSNAAMHQTLMKKLIEEAALPMLDNKHSSHVIENAFYNTTQTYQQQLKTLLKQYKFSFNRKYHKNLKFMVESWLDKIQYEIVYCRSSKFFKGKAQLP